MEMTWNAPSTVFYEVHHDLAEIVKEKHLSQMLLSLGLIFSLVFS